MLLNFDIFHPARIGTLKSWIKFVEGLFGGVNNGLRLCKSDLLLIVLTEATLEVKLLPAPMLFLHRQSQVQVPNLRFCFSTVLSL